MHTIGWRLTQQWAALSCLLMALPVTLFVFHRPEDVGCLPDGARPEDRHTDPEAAEARAEERRGLISGTDEDEDEDEEEVEEAQPATPVAGSDFTLGEALRTSALWLLNLDTTIGWMFGAGVGFHMVSIIQSNHDDRSMGATAIDVAMHVYFP